MGSVCVHRIEYSYMHDVFFLNMSLVYPVEHILLYTLKNIVPELIPVVGQLNINLRKLGLV
jgi:hypothetical protein